MKRSYFHNSSFLEILNNTVRYTLINKISFIDSSFTFVCFINRDFILIHFITLFFVRHCNRKQYKSCLLYTSFWMDASLQFTKMHPLYFINSIIIWPKIVSLYIKNLNMIETIWRKYIMYTFSILKNYLISDFLNLINEMCIRDRSSNDCMSFLRRFSQSLWGILWYWFKNWYAFWRLWSSSCSWFSRWDVYKRQESMW